MPATAQYVDRKGEAGNLEFNQGTFNAVNFVTYFAPLSYVGFTTYNQVTTTDFVGAPATIGTALVNNDKDFKAILGFEGAEGHFKISIPAPKINIEGGIVIRWGQNRAIVPPIKTPEEVGVDGAGLSAIVAAFLGMTPSDVKFKYGRLIKRS